MGWPLSTFFLPTLGYLLLTSLHSREQHRTNFASTSPLAYLFTSVLSCSLLKIITMVPAIPESQSTALRDHLIGPLHFTVRGN